MIKIMNNMILEFLEVYKSLDELCRQILSSDRGVSDYIDEMENEIQGYMKVNCWGADYKRLKKMRWIRNQLVHEINSFEDDLINVEDIEWLKDFRSRIMECTDPFSLLYQSKNQIRKEENQENYFEISKQRKSQENYFESTKQEKSRENYFEATRQEKNLQNYSETNGQSDNWKLVVGAIILTAIIMIAVIIAAVAMALMNLRL